MGRVEGANSLAAGLLGTFRFALEKWLEVTLDADHPILPFMTNAIGWYITRFQPREHGGSSYKFLFGK
eukprot:3957239-Pyramimonas_sp.AAC.1